MIYSGAEILHLADRQRESVAKLKIVKPVSGEMSQDEHSHRRQDQGRETTEALLRFARFIKGATQPKRSQRQFLRNYKRHDQNETESQSLGLMLDIFA